MERSSSDIEKFNLKKTSYILGSIFPSPKKKRRKCMLGQLLLFTGCSSIQFLNSPTFLSLPQSDRTPLVPLKNTFSKFPSQN